MSLLDKRPPSGLRVEGVGDGKGVASVRCKPSKLHDAVFVVDAVAETDVTGKRGKVKKRCEPFRGFTSGALAFRCKPLILHGAAAV